MCVICCGRYYENSVQIDCWNCLELTSIPTLPNLINLECYHCYNYLTIIPELLISKHFSVLGVAG